ncbi:MAG: hypothetical protein H0S84_07290 [Bacteroidales bacterium]|nr:hypothetical protein [Bacteroidales bacterium]
MTKDLLRRDPTLNKSNSWYIKFSSDLIDFLNLLYAPTVVLDYDRNSFTDDICSDSPKVIFNSHTSPKAYYDSLLNLDKVAQKEIINVLKFHELKHDKLEYLFFQITKLEEYKSYLKVDSNGQYSHLLFSYKNLCTEEPYRSQNYVQADFQPYFKWLEFFLDNFHKFLKNLYDKTEKTNQSDFPIISITASPNESISSDPFRYFYYLFLKKGINKLLKDFIPNKYAMSELDIRYDKETQSYSFYDYDTETGKTETTIHKFSDHLLKILHEEYRKSEQLVKTNITKLNDEPSIKLYLKKNLSSLKYLLDNVQKSKLIDKYPVTELLLLTLIKWLFEEYEEFCPPKFETFYQKVNERLVVLKSGNNSIPSSPKSLAVSNTNKIVTPEGFFWLTKDEELNQHLYIALSNGPEPFIDPQTGPEAINRLFSIPGNYSSVPKIKWNLMHKNKPNKTILLYLFVQLMEKKLVRDFTDKDLKQKINEFFCWGENQEEFYNLDVSLSSLKKGISNTPNKKAIDEIITKLQAVVFSA